MKLLSVVVLFAGLSLGASTLQAEEVIQPKPPEKTSEKVADKPAEKYVEKPVDKIVEVKPEDGPKKDPFSPSALMRMRAQKPVENVAPSAPSAAPIAVLHALPMLEGVLVKNNSVLASFKLGNRSIVIEPRNAFVADDINYTFIGYANEVASLRDEEGRIHDLRIIQHASSNPPRTQAQVPAPTDRQPDR